MKINGTFGYIVVTGISNDHTFWKAGVTGMGTGGSGMGTATGSVVGAGLGHNSAAGVIQGNGVINRSGQ